MSAATSFNDLLDELTFDALERLGVHPHDMPTNTAMAFFRSMMRIPGTHTHSRMLEEVRREQRDRDDRHEAIQGHAGVAAIGGSVGETKVNEFSAYWKDILSNGSRR